MLDHLTKARVILLLFGLAAGLVLWDCQRGPSLAGELDLPLPEVVDFNFHIRPLLSDRCYKCHGPDDNTREAGLRLDLKDGAFDRLPDSGKRALVPGSKRRSAVWTRISSDDPEYMMPPPDSHLKLDAREKALIARWIEQGAEWKDHWAFLVPTPPALPPVEGPTIHNEIDQFIQAKLAEQGLQPSLPAGRERLIRRVSMDLTGLPPTLDEVDAFVADESPSAYEELVDRLLAAETSAERLALEWLDVARYGDTQGLHMDAERRYWPWRDWLIEAFHQNMPYDTFIIWQMGGDLLPKPKREQILATAFHRNHPISSEGGVANEEFRQKYVQDRTNTTATAFLGLTMECASCHDHKFDPISQREYYQMSAFFNNLNELGLVNESSVYDSGLGPKHSSGPVLLLPDSAQEKTVARLKETIARLRDERATLQVEVDPTHKPHPATRPPQAVATFAFDELRPTRVEHGVVHRIQNNQPVDKMVDRDRRSLACGELEVVPGKVGSALRSPGEMDLVFLKSVGHFDVGDPYTVAAWIRSEKTGEFQSIVGSSGAMGNGWRGWDFFIDTSDHLSIKLVSMLPQNYMQVTSEAQLPVDQWSHVVFSYDGSGQARGLRLYIDGQQVPVLVDNDHLYSTIRRRWRPSSTWPERPLMVFRSGRYHTGENGVFTGSIDQLNFYDHELSALDVALLYQQEAGETDAQADWGDLAADHALRNHPRYQLLGAQLKEALDEWTQLTRQIPEVMVMQEMQQRRSTYILDRGQYDSPTEQVYAATPAAILPFSEHLPKNRLGLAQWLVSPEHPLTSRVTVNRYWQMLFGRGLVETPHDFGTQGALPTHPKLLDWLALDFQQSGWDLRALLKKMVMSYTYRQASEVTPDHQAADPKNLWLARAPSYRWQAELIRDNALAAAGVLNPTVGGPSVKPYQPEGIWDYGGLVSGRYQADTTGGQYRRSMYTYIRRTSPHPAMVAFDAPPRSVCTVRRENTNSPIQALVLLNDPQFVEAAKVLAQRMQRTGGPSIDEQLILGFRLACGRRPSKTELGLLQEQYQASYDRFADDRTAAADLLQTGVAGLDPNLSVTKTAALTVVASSLFNFDEAYMKR